MKSRAVVFTCSFALSLKMATGLITDADYFYRTDRPLIIAHRGSWGDYPEHSIAGYIEAYYAGADFLEFDLQVTKDNQLVMMHDP